MARLIAVSLVVVVLAAGCLCYAARPEVVPYVPTIAPPPTVAPSATPAARPATPMTSEQAQMARTLKVELVDLQKVDAAAQAGGDPAGVRPILFYRNLGDKDIRAFTGVTHLSDLFGRERKALWLTVDVPLAAGQETYDQNWIFKTNSLSADDNWLATVQIVNVKFTFEPKAILFTDGTQLGRIP